MAYGEYANSGRSIGKCLYQLSKIGIPVHIVESVIFFGNGLIQFRNKDFASVEWNEIDEPIFLFKGEYSYYNKSIKQSKCIILMGSNSRETLVPESLFTKVGCFTDVHGLAFKEELSKHNSFYLADIEGNRLREQVLTTTTFEDKFNRLKNKFTTREIKHY